MPLLLRLLLLLKEVPKDMFAALDVLDFGTKNNQNVFKNMMGFVCDKTPLHSHQDCSLLGMTTVSKTEDANKRRAVADLEVFLGLRKLASCEIEIQER